MAYSRLRVGSVSDGFEFDKTNGAYHEYVADAYSDLANIPLDGTGIDKPRPGSKCLTLDTANVYVLAPSGTWQLLIEGDV